MSSPAAAFYPVSPKAALKATYVGQSIRNIPTPAVIIDVAAARRNCERMLQACDRLKLSWRAHVKTHKTVELARLQVGADAARPANLIVSTLAEAEFLLPALTEYRSQGRRVNVLYGLPVGQNAVPRLAAVAQSLGPGSVSVLLDDPAQLPVVSRLRQQSGFVPDALIKIDMGGRRAGVVADSARFLELADAALEAHKQGDMCLAGLYSHAGHSYGGDSRVAALKMMKAEISAMRDGADCLRARAADKGVSELSRLTLSAGASPTALSAEAASLAALFDAVKDEGHTVEIHAGVYPTLDLQQLAAHSLSSSRLSWGDIALTVLAEVHSVYPERGADGTAEVLIGAGLLALGREPPGVDMPAGDVEDFQGWVVGRFSQEHGILTWTRSQTDKPGPTPEQGMVEVGQRVRLWPNHACITSSHYGWYFVVDQGRAGKEDEIVDIWPRAKGW
ncbi:putative serine dehydratase domain-containing protein [Hirsutella rhossiliensis]|uniref:D-serine dehydratase n=1 Tax=Hirsutella rhossiliensis TaxID=111463 RepID=A0A9P8MWG0_9HYPO|nr:putative serine dehydratase domain-containing protein [Hirsutella rhossiliensis]KAH0961481.1 putative serine dehydratase domain-containing protein [Hirsutella rhossiliensis]